jgi:iron complex outermembrane receptor protein
MKRTTTSLALLCALLPLPALAQPSVPQFTLRGTVVDQETKEPIAGATISAGRDDGRTITDARGRFTLTNDRPIRAITVRSIGYQPSTIQVTDGSASLNIQLAPSNLLASEVQVTGFAPGRKLLENAAPVALLTEQDFHRNNEVFLQNTLNLVPGVQMNVRSASSQSNLLIRGIGTYSRFSIRGVKLYLNDVPLTDPDGTATIDDIDFPSIGRAEIVKGPASSIYGANLGGVVLLRTRNAQYGEMALEQSVTAGSFGLLRSSTAFTAGDDKVNSYIGYGHQQIDGFRPHSNSTKEFATVSSDFFLSDRQTVSVLANYTGITDKYAGELDSTSFRTEPAQAFAPYINKDIGLNEDLTRLAVTNSFDFTPDFSNTTTLFTTGVAKVSPVEPRYSRSTQSKYGGRTLFAYNPTIGGLATRFNAGAEFNTSYLVSKAYKISDSGAVGAISGDNEVYSYQTNIFAQAEAELLENTTLTVGAAYNLVIYRNLDYLKSNLSGRRAFDPVITPRIALVHVFGDKVSVFAQYSTGFLPPVASQITLAGVDLPTYINTDLKPEKNTDIEIGSRGAILDDRLNYDLTLYSMKVTDALVSQTVSGVTAFVNAGRSSYMGAELSASYLLLNEGDASGIRMLRPWVSYAYNKTKFDEYVLGGKDFSGNQVTGTTPNLISAGLDFELDAGAYVDLTYQYIDKMPMRDDNTLFSDAYSLINARAGYRTRLGDHFKGEIYAGADNLADTKYAASIALNAADGRYYAPAPGRSFYGGLTVGYLF